MAKFITTTEISYSIEELIVDAKEFVIWVTPYVQIHSRLKVLIEKKLKATPILMSVICREKELSTDAKDWFLANGVRLYFNECLHAKCYLNESTAILTSMNLYHYSMVNNIEFGMIIKKDEDDKNYSAIFSECLQTQKSTLPAIEIMTIVKLAEEFQAVDVRLVSHKETGNDYVHLINSEEKYISIKVGDKVKFQTTDYEEKLKDLISNYVIYSGENINGRWFTFNPPPSKE